LNREEHPPLENFCRSKKLSIYSEIDDISQQEGRRGQSTNYEDDLLQESESEDEDFVAKEVSDVDEEFDSEFSSSDDEGGEEKTKRRKDSSDQESGSASEDENETAAPELSATLSKKVKKTKPSSQGEPKKKKQKKEGPKRPLTSFLYFSMDKRAQIKEKNPEMGLGDISKELGVMWKAVSADEKEKYEKMALKDKERYSRELKDFQRTGVLPGGSAVSTSKLSKPSTEATKKVDPIAKAKVKSEEFIRDSDEDDF
jgi:hypothetical protein